MIDIQMSIKWMITLVAAAALTLGACSGGDKKNEAVKEQIAKTPVEKPSTQPTKTPNPTVKNGQWVKPDTSAAPAPNETVLLPKSTIVASGPVALALQAGLDAQHRGDLNEAIAQFTRAIEGRAPSDVVLAQAYNNRGAAYADTGDAEKAMSDFNTALSFNPRLAEAYNNRGALWVGMRKNERALDDFNKALSLDTRYAEAYNNRGNFFRRTGRPNQAFNDFNRAVEFKPDYAAAYANRGLLFGAAAQYKEAVLDFTAAIELEPIFAGAYYYRALAYKELSDTARAKADVKKALELEPENELFKSLLEELQG